MLVKVLKEDVGIDFGAYGKLTIPMSTDNRCPYLRLKFVPPTSRNGEKRGSFISCMRIFLKSGVTVLYCNSVSFILILYLLGFDMNSSVYSSLSLNAQFHRNE